MCLASNRRSHHLSQQHVQGKRRQHRASGNHWSRWAVTEVGWQTLTSYLVRLGYIVFVCCLEGWFGALQFIRFKKHWMKRLWWSVGCVISAAKGTLEEMKILWKEPPSRAWVRTPNQQAPSDRGQKEPKWTNSRAGFILLVAEDGASS